MTATVKQCSEESAVLFFSLELSKKTWIVSFAVSVPSGIRRRSVAGGSLAAWRRQTGDLCLSGLHAPLRTDSERLVHGEPSTTRQADARQAARDQNGTPQASAP